MARGLLHFWVPYGPLRTHAFTCEHDYVCCSLRVSTRRASRERATPMHPSGSADSCQRSTFARSATRSSTDAAIMQRQCIEAWRANARTARLLMAPLVQTSATNERARARRTRTDPADTSRPVARDAHVGPLRRHEHLYRECHLAARHATCAVVTAGPDEIGHPARFTVR
jgi:hypothetical protein